MSERDGQCSKSSESMECSGQRTQLLPTSPERTALSLFTKDEFSPEGGEQSSRISEILSQFPTTGKF
ncbi:unnamed protein product [Anisakis simplex]|uniref:Uncharacterized protein n=1 Tax=Anisakis simplex TaxID=6269 RepID=A0A0M3JF65_ANISI|nr:unnamed protein product [Anisakis simplex]